MGYFAGHYTKLSLVANAKIMVSDGKPKCSRTVSPVIAPYAPPILDIQLFLELISNTPAMTSAAP